MTPSPFPVAFWGSTCCLVNKWRAVGIIYLSNSSQLPISAVRTAQPRCVESTDTLPQAKCFPAPRWRGWAGIMGVALPVSVCCRVCQERSDGRWTTADLVLPGKIGMGSGLPWGGVGGREGRGVGTAGSRGSPYSYYLRKGCPALILIPAQQLSGANSVHELAPGSVAPAPIITMFKAGKDSRQTAGKALTLVLWLSHLPCPYSAGPSKPGLLVHSQSLPLPLGDSNHLPHTR